ncbi:ATP-dependent nuclease [Lawsonella clevelandensis]|uniref:DNA replication and repair protein RecF n=1 Tax=Lawsonella clevelandensis TaxID=1528099 RepID=A0A5E3ZYZ6_9ACTN|nr:AAA family ATPase [Lawsonella clevelandensis]VHO01578.1 DNA replication and repair protein RecF [Lawsonella clevelandensis]
MITKVHIRGYRKFKELILNPHHEMNIIVGANEAGKSTLLEAVTMVLTGKFEGVTASEALNPYWFNMELVDAFFNALSNMKVDEPLPAIPEFRIDIHLEIPDGESQKMRGIHNMLKEDSVGLSVHAYPDPDYSEEIEQYFREDNCPHILPVEYYRLDWRDFADQVVYRRPKELGVAVIDTRTIRSDRGMDYYTRQIVEERLDPKVRNHVSVEHRKMRASLGDSLLTVLDGALGTDFSAFRQLKLGIQVDQSRSSSWANTLVPAIDKVPFSQSGKGTQATAKTVLAMGRSSNSSAYLLVEEPENHLSHTSLRELLSYISAAREGRQVLVTTHSSYVLNRLGLDQLVLLREGTAHAFQELSDDTSEYFKKLAGFDTLRLVLAKKAVLVEGPSDEIIFNRFFLDKYGAEPLDYGVDVISIGGVSFRRGFELASVLNQPLVALRDNDGKTPEHWQDKIKDFTKPNERELFVGQPNLGRSLEYQITSANTEDTLRTVLGLDNNADLLDWMSTHKTATALKIATSSVKLNPPKYIADAINSLQSVVIRTRGLS